MPPLLEDPRIRQTWNQFSQNVESGTETAAEGIWSFAHNYLNPCFSNFSHGLQDCTGKCFPTSEERARRARERARQRGEAEFSFDFYDDWDNEGDGGSAQGLLGWGNNEWDRLLAGSGAGSEDRQPGRKRGMSYGTRGRGPRRKSTLDGLPDPTVIPSTSAFGFLGRLPFKIGGTLRYKPSAADLQDHPGATREDLSAAEEREPLIDDDEADEEFAKKQKHARKRSSTQSSGETTDSFRSRGDLFPSDEDVDDAVPLDDEFAMVLARRTTLSGTDDRSSGKTKKGKGKWRTDSTLSRTLSDATKSSSHSRPSLNRNRGSDHDGPESPRIVEVPSMTDLQREEERLQREEDEEVERKREAAGKLARERGLSSTEKASEDMEQQPEVEEIPAPEPETEAAGAAAPTRSTVSDKAHSDSRPANETKPPDQDFVPARLPHF